MSKIVCDNKKLNVGIASRKENQRTTIKIGHKITFIM